MKIYVTLKSKKVVTPIFGSPQDPEIWPGLVEMEDDDPSYLKFLEPVEVEVVDPVDKLKKFLAENPDVAKIIE